MKLLLDTCAFLWFAESDAELSVAAKDAFRDPDNEIFLSSISAWEISIKYSLGKLSLRSKPERYVADTRKGGGIASLAVDEETALFVANLPLLHRDPFDRILVAQAVVHGMTILTPDDAIRQYAVRTLW
jgi:PIN domain nuclease of toxin-antitoxin system